MIWTSALAAMCVSAFASADVVLVQQSGLDYIPQHVTVAPGDTVQILWGNGNHSVTTGANCTFGSSAGYEFDLPLTVANPEVNIAIAADSGSFVLHYYCDVGEHCADGMFGSITVKAAPMPGDFNGDGVVNGGDLGLLLAAWATLEAKYDLNGDGIINGADLGLFLALWT